MSGLGMASYNAIQTFLYKEGLPLPDLNPYLFRIIEIRIPAADLTTANKAVAEHRCWGTDIYTCDSDLVCVLQHSGYKRLSTSPPPDIAGVSVFVKILRGRSSYSQTMRNGLRSRRWTGESSHSLRIVRVDDLLDSLGSPDEVEVMRLKQRTTLCGRKRLPYRRGDLRFVAGASIAFNLCNEPVTKYSLSAICDRGMNPAHWIATRLESEILLLETNTSRYQLALSAESRAKSEESPGAKTYTFGRVVCPRYLTKEVIMFSRSPVESPPSSNRPESMSSPLARDQAALLTDVLPGLSWEEIRFGRTCVSVAQQTFGPLCSLEWISWHDAAPEHLPFSLCKDMPHHERALFLMCSALQNGQAAQSASKCSAYDSVDAIEHRDGVSEG